MAGFYNMGFSEVANLISEPDGTAKAINIARAVNFISFGGYMFLPAALFAVINRTGIVHEGGLNVTQIQCSLHLFGHFGLVHPLCRLPYRLGAIY